MKKKISVYTNSTIALFGGISGFTLLYITFFFINPLLVFLPTGLLTFLLLTVFNSFCEEGTKCLLIKKWAIGKFPYGLLLGFSWGAIEIFMRYVVNTTQLNLVNSSMVIGLQTMTAGILCYYVKKNRPILGLLLAITVHTVYNLIVAI